MCAADHNNNDNKTTISSSIDENKSTVVSFKKRRINNYLIFFSVLLLFLSILLNNNNNWQKVLFQKTQKFTRTMVMNKNNNDEVTTTIIPNSIYVPGGGFSGFWYTIGRLHHQLNSIDKNNNMDLLSPSSYYCYSAGCLAVVAGLSNSTLEEMIEFATNAQNKWLSGEIHRYDVVQNFLNTFLSTNKVQENLKLSNIHIITTAAVVVSNNDENGLFRRFFGSNIPTLKPIVRTPSNLEELNEMLLQTTWIPYVLGETLLWYNKDNNKTKTKILGHMDGGIMRYAHPVCSHSIQLPFTFTYIWNTINVGLKPELVHKYYNDGYNY